MNKNVIIYSKFPLVREWLAYSLDKIGWNVIHKGDTSSTKESDVAIVEVKNFKDLSILEEIDIPVVIFSRLPETKLIGLLFDYEVSGIIRLSSNSDSIKETMESTERGEEYYDEVWLTYLLSDKYREIHERINSLSKREHEIIEGIMEDMTNDEIAEKFDLSVRTVNAHKRNILHKLQERSLVGVIKTVLTYTLRYS